MAIFQKDLFEEIRNRAIQRGSKTSYHIHVNDEQERIENINDMSSFYGPILDEIISEYCDEKPPLFGNVMLSTINRCNGHCSFCAACIDVDTRIHKRMDEELLDNVLMQLAELQYNGRITLNGLNEPFMDNRMGQIIKKISEMVPNARIHIITNGTLLTKKVLDDIFPLCSKIHINCYGDGKTVPDRIKKLCEPYTGTTKLKIEPRYQVDVLSQFGENECGRTQKNVMTCACIMPYNTISVTPSGIVNLCISDISDKYIVGDLNRESLLEIWYSKKMELYRSLMKGGRQNIALCKECDMFCF